jgi:hypothetical protein
VWVRGSRSKGRRTKTEKYKARNTDLYVGSIAVYRARRRKEKENEGTDTDREEISGWKRKKK